MDYPVLRPFMWTIVVLMIGFIIFSLVLWPTWNYAVPKVVESIDPTFYSTKSFDNIGFPQALGISLLVGMIFGQSVVASSTEYLLHYAEKYPGKKRKTDMSYDSVFADA